MISSLDNRFINVLKALSIAGGILMISFGLSFRCTAFPVWSVDNDMIGIKDNDYTEFKEYAPVPSIIQYHVEDDWINFPHKLTTKLYKPHTVHILFDTNSYIESRNLVMGITTDQPTGQVLKIYFDGYPVSKIQIQMGPYQNKKIWLGPIEKGSHCIIIENETSPDPDTRYGVYFDYLQLIPTKTIPRDYKTIAEGIQDSLSGDIIYVKNGEYKENNIRLKSGMLLIGEDPHLTVINGEGKTIIYGNNQCHIKNFTIKNGGNTVTEETGIGIFAVHDSIYLSSNIISSCAAGVLLVAQNLDLINNTIVENDCGIYVQRDDLRSTLPSLNCRNNIFKDCNYALYVFNNNDKESSFYINPNSLYNVIKEFSYNDIFCKLTSNININLFGNGNIFSDPYFVDPDGDDYHLMPYSPCIDTGDPNSDFFREPDDNDNGQRINMGAFGNSAWATATMDSDGDGVKDYLEGPLDLDHDGREDWLDKQTSSIRLTAGQEKICISLAEDTNASLSLTKLRAIDERDPNISYFDLPTQYILYGFWGLNIIGMDQGGKTTLDIYFPQKLFDILEYYTFDNEKGWIITPFVQDLSMRRISIEVSDGTPEDMDKTENGTIYHIGGVGIPSPFHKGLDSTSCFIECFENIASPL